MCSNYIDVRGERYNSKVHGGEKNRIGGVMVSVLASNAVDRRFEPRSGQTKDFKTGDFASPPST